VALTETLKWYAPSPPVSKPPPSRRRPNVKRQQNVVWQLQCGADSRPIRLKVSKFHCSRSATLLGLVHQEVRSVVNYLALVVEGKFPV
jgi:hypothetical protein